MSKNKNIEDEGDDECFTGLSKLKTFDDDFGELERISYTLQKYNKIKSENISDNIKDDNNNINDTIENNNDTDINRNNIKVIDDNIKIEEENENHINNESELLTTNNIVENEEDAIKINEVADLFNKDISNKNEEIQSEGGENNTKINKDKNKLCSICKEQLYGIKFICALCEKLILCESCESQHNHPYFIYKSKFISSLKETFIYISQNYDTELSKSNSNFFSKLITSNIELSIILIGDKNISLRPNKKYMKPIKFINHTNKIINSSHFILLITGNKLINIIYDEKQNFNILPKSNYILKLLCQTPSKFCCENINMELYSSTINLKPNNKLKINTKIEINEDQEEETLNEKLLNDDKVILYNKEHKKIISSLLENEFKGYNPINVIENLIKCNWNRDKCIKEVKSKEQKK